MHRIRRSSLQDGSIESSARTHPENPQSERWKPTVFVPAEYEDGNEIFFLPLCSACGELIRDLKLGNILYPKSEARTLLSAREPRIVGIAKQALIVHKSCDVGTN